MKEQTPDEQLIDEVAKLGGTTRAAAARAIEQVKAKPVPKMHSYQFKILSLLQSKPIYEGQVGERTGAAGRAKRRAAGRAQKAARRANRR
ncbi:MAG: hypothetical protein IPJ61_20650 [Tessaracoccus sp.]|uniref:hypothetical protein n=1 Tax=Tessaracoccus sp. TaxID=1971211 RepID=UPI001EBEF76E|nr:hypothetical protein [Tessaracoccus sp.]MBK7823399.1 hypothetical protein [Tessaracoccus sp.]